MYTISEFLRISVWGRCVGRLGCVVALSVGLAACGGSDDDSSTPTPDKPEPPPAAVIHCAP